MITFGEVLQALETQKSLFFRGPQSRKPYKVKVSEIMDIFPKHDKQKRRPSPGYVKQLDSQEVADANVRIVFTNGEVDASCLRFLFASWDKAAEDKPIRQPQCNCGDPNCKDWRHWYQMSRAAKALMLKENPTYGETDVGGGVIVNRPPIIPGGWGYWEAIAEQQQAKISTGEPIACSSCNWQGKTSLCKKVTDDQDENLICPNCDAILE